LFGASNIVCHAELGLISLFWIKA